MDDLKYIKRHYGEKLAHFCRDNFATILQQEGLLTRVLSSSFAETHSLFDDLKGYEGDFKDYIFSKYDKLHKRKKVVGKAEKTPQELMSEAHYILHPECLSEKDVQAFRHYYKRDDGQTVVYQEGHSPAIYNGEELCTFNGGRLDFCRVFFATKDNVDEIRRIDYPLPGEDFRAVGGKSFDDVKDEYAKLVDPNKRWYQLTKMEQFRALRDNEYGTSVISIQISKIGRETISIKNRYNHHLPHEINPDATFGNDLDKIAEGLVNSFNVHFGMDIENYEDVDFQLPHYVLAGNGKRYRFNNEQNAVYFCENNVIVDHGQPVFYDPAQYLVMDNGMFIDFQSKQIFSHDSYSLSDSFRKTLESIDRISVSTDKKSGRKTVSIGQIDKDNVNLTFDRHNCLIGIEDPNIVNIPYNYCISLHNVQFANFENAEKMDRYCFHICKKMSELKAPNLKEIGEYCFYINNFNSLSLPQLKRLGSFCFKASNSLEKIYAPELEYLDAGSFHCVNGLKELYLPSLIETGANCFQTANNLKSFVAPKLISLGMFSLTQADQLTDFVCPSLETLSQECLYHVNGMKSFVAPNLTKMSSFCFAYAKSLEEVDTENLKTLSQSCFRNAEKLRVVNMPNLENKELCCFQNSENIEILVMPESVRGDIVQKNVISNEFSGNFFEKHATEESNFDGSQDEISAQSVFKNGKSHCLKGDLSQKSSTCNAEKFNSQIGQNHTESIEQN